MFSPPPPQHSTGNTESIIAMVGACSPSGPKNTSIFRSASGNKGAADVLRGLCPKCCRLIAGAEFLSHSCLEPSTPLHTASTLLRSLCSYITFTDNADYIFHRCNHYTAHRRALERVRSVLRILYMCLTARNSVGSITRRQNDDALHPAVLAMREVLGQPECGSDISLRFHEFSQAATVLLTHVTVVAN
eukprot:PhM_4_TR358/c0_g1_i1/m.71428